MTAADLAELLGDDIELRIRCSGRGDFSVRALRTLRSGSIVSASCDGGDDLDDQIVGAVLAAREDDAC